MGWVVLLATTFAGGVAFLFAIYPFLAVTERVDARSLVMEGWIPIYAVRSTAEEFHRGEYDRILTTGGPITGMGGYSNDYNTSANLGAGRLRAEGVPSASIQGVPSRVSGRDRTYSAAVALRRWLDQSGREIKAVNLITTDTHARRSRLLFQEALGDRVRVGVIAVTNPDYDAKHWWRYSEGVKDVLTETFAYLYAKIFFHPSSDSDNGRQSD